MPRIMRIILRPRTLAIALCGYGINICKLLMKINNTVLLGIGHKLHWLQQWLAGVLEGDVRG